MIVARDIISVNVNMFSGDLLLTCTYVQDVNPEAYSQLAKGRSVYTFCPELHHLDKLGFKLCTIFRLGRVRSLIVLCKDGSPHSMQIPLMVQEAAEDIGFNKANIQYFCLEGGELHSFSDLAVRKARHYSEIERLLPFARLDKVAAVLRGENGCPNDREETMRSVVDHLREEVDEIEMALKKEDNENLLEEIGDVLFNIALLGRIASENKLSDLADFADQSAQKMIDKHPAVFGNLRLKY
jgi:NTP pyrophosphatase (non-canonical NTP hydrolase)